MCLKRRGEKGGKERELKGVAALDAGWRDGSLVETGMDLLQHQPVNASQMGIKAKQQVVDEEAKRPYCSKFIDVLPT